MIQDAEKRNYISSPDDTIEEAWTKIESNQHRSLIIVENNKVVGTLSDGDLRKAMLSRRLLSTPVREVMNVNFFSLSEHERRQSKRLFKEKRVFLIPIIDEELNLLDIIVN